MSDSPSGGVDEQKVLGNQTEAETDADKEERRSAKDFGSLKGGRQTMLVKVQAPFREYYNGRAFSVSAENATGPFDILPKHHNFISLLSPCDLTIRTTNGNEQKISISGGIIHVKADELTIFLDV